MAKILVVDDEIEIVELLKIYLINSGYQVFKAFNSEEALTILDREEIDAAILDIMLPKVDGFGLLVKIREKYNFPIMFLSARGEDMDKISGLGMGADDYMVKPFNPLEVIARIQALLRRSSKINSGSTDADKTGFLVSFGDLTLNTEACELYKKGKLIQITSMEYKLLLFFLENPNRVFTKQQLYDKVWGEDYLSDDNIIMVYISKLREKIEDNPKEPRYIKTIRGLGYRFERK
jgi:DNA-binding response OmpR family regulator